MNTSEELLVSYYADFSETVDTLLEGQPIATKLGRTIFGFGKLFESKDVPLWSPIVAAGTTLRLREIITTKYRFGSSTLLGHVIGGEIMDKEEALDGSSIMQTRWGVIMATGEMGITQTFQSPRFEPEEARAISEERFAHYGMDSWPVLQQWEYLVNLLSHAEAIDANAA